MTQFPKLTLIACMVLTACVAKAQITQPATGLFEDALIYAQQNPVYSSRMQGLGGASVGLGGDISNAATNPAGLGMLRKSEFSITPGLLFTGSTTSSTTAERRYNGYSTDTSISQFHFGHLGIAFARPVSDVRGGSFRGGTFAITLTRLNNFSSIKNYNQDALYQYTGGSPANSLDSLNIPSSNSYNYNYFGLLVNDPANHGTDLIGKDRNDGSLTTSQYLIRQAYGAFLVDTVGGGGRYYLNQPNSDVRQSGYIRRSGRSQQFDFSYGANFEDRLFLGGGIGIPKLDQTTEVAYNETLYNVVRPSGQPDLSEWNGFQTARVFYSRTDGIGINAKGGVIYRINDMVRIGASVQTPTLMRVTNDFTFTLAANYHNIPLVDGYRPGLVEGDEDQVYTTTYNLRLPFQASAGFSLLESKYGLFTFEAQYINYKGTRFTSVDNGNLAGDNAALQLRARNVVNLKAGVEGRYQNFRLRLGGGVIPNPYRNINSAKFTNLISLSGGVGYRTERFYADLGIQYYTLADESLTVLRKGDLSPYFGTEELTSNSIRNTQVQLSLGVFF